MKKIFILSILLIFECSLTFGSSTANREKRFEIDLKNRQLKILSEVCLNRGQLEFLLCSCGTKEHESILITDVPASQIHAGLLSLGLVQGIPGRWTNGTDNSRKYIPPRGPEIKIILKWADSKGRQKSVKAGQWLTPIKSSDKAVPEKWVFVGSMVLSDNTYAADNSGEIISVSNFPQAVIDVPFESSNADALREFKAASEQIPPKGTKVTLVITVDEASKKSPYARAVVDIDRLGRCRVDGKPIPMTQLRKWARSFISRYPKAMVQLRCETRTMIYDVERAREELVLGGIFEIHEIRPGLHEAPLPRTASQIEAKLDNYKQRLSKDDGILSDTPQDIRNELKRIEDELILLKDKRVVLEQYSSKLKLLLKKNDDK